MRFCFDPNTPLSTTTKRADTSLQRKGERERERERPLKVIAGQPDPELDAEGESLAQCLVRLLWDFPALPYEYTESSSSKSPLQWQQVLIMLDTEWKEGAYKQPNSLPMMCSPWDSKLGLTFLLPELLLCLIHFISTNYNLQNIFTNNYHYY